jgi:hypothetical protein
MTERKHYKSDFLFAQGSFLLGIASSISISGNFFEFNQYESENVADSRALNGDWQIVGQDLYDAMETVKLEDFKCQGTKGSELATK